MDDDRKAPPQAVPEGDRKPPAAAAAAAAAAAEKIMPPSANPSKKRKTTASSEEDGGDKVVDVAAGLNYRDGDRIEVKWTINGDDDDEEDSEGQKEGGDKKDGVDKSAKQADDGKGEAENNNEVNVWWTATLAGRTDRIHTLTPEERGETEGGNYALCNLSAVKLPIYQLNYSPLKEFGFEEHSMEEVAFISNQTLLNLSTDEIMLFRKVGQTSPPPSPTPEQIVAEATAGVVDESVVAKDFNGREEIASFMDQIMQRCLASTGMDKRMKTLPMSEQQAMAERIRKAREGMLEKIMEETDKMGVGNKVITADVVRKCMGQMEGGY